MVKELNLKVNSEQMLILDNIVSGLLPHKNFKSELFMEVLYNFFDIVKPEELYGFHLVVYRFLERSQKFAVLRKTTAFKLNLDNFERALSDSIELFLKSSEFDAEAFFSDYGLNFNLEIPKDLNAAVDSAYSIIVDHYKELFEMAFPTEDIPNELSTLSASLEFEYCILASQMGSELLLNGDTERGVTITGPEIFKSSLRSMLDMIDLRFSVKEKTIFNKVTTLDSYQTREAFMEKNKVQYSPIFTSHIDPIGQLCTYRTQDIVTIVANEGVGKTTYVVGDIYDAITQGKNVLGFTGESAQAKIVAMIEAIHVFKMFGIRLSSNEILDPSVIPDSAAYTKERIKEMIQAAKVDLYDNPAYGKFSPANSFNYASFDDELAKEMQKMHHDVIVIDHVGAMDKTLTPKARELRLFDNKSRIDHLMYMEDRLVKIYNCMFINLCHTNTETEKALSKDKGVGSRITAGSGDTSKYSTHIWLLSTNAELKRNNRLSVELNKVRDYEYIEPFIIDREAMVPYFTYDPSHQYVTDDSDIDVDELID